MRAAEALLARIEAWALGALVLAMTGVTLAQVVARYLFGEPLIWSEEAARYLFVWVSMLGAALALRGGQHYALSALVERLPPGAAARLARALAFLVTLGFILLLFATGLAETHQAHLQEAATLPMRMSLAYAALPVGAGLMLIHLLAGPRA